MTIFGKLELDVAAPPPVGTGKVELDGDDWQLGFNAGTLFELSEQTRLGLTYFSGVDFDLGGDVKVTGGGLTLANVGVNTDLPLPQMVRAGVYHDINSRWALLGTIAWEEWSELDTVNISTGTNGAALPKNWDDVWHFAIGLHYRPSTQWLLQAGLAYDTSPVDAEDRTADMPIDEQIRYALGAQYAWSEKLSIGAQFEYIDLGNAEIKGPLLNGDYKTNDLFIFGFNLNWKL